MAARASLSETRVSGALAVASAGITLGSAGYALAFIRPLGPLPDEPLDAAAYNRRQAPAQMRLHLFLALAHALMAPAAVGRVPGSRIATASVRVSGAAAEALMLVSMLTQARAWKNLSSLYDSAVSDEERARTLDYMEGPNTTWTEPAGVALWAVSAAAAAMSLRRYEPWRAALSAAAAFVWIAQLLRPSELARALSIAARIILFGLSGASLCGAPGRRRRLRPGP